MDRTIYPLHVTSGGELKTVRPDRIVQVRPFARLSDVPAKAALLVYVDDDNAPDQLRLVELVTDQTYDAVVTRIRTFLSAPRPGALSLRGISALYAKKRGDLPNQLVAATENDEPVTATTGTPSSTEAQGGSQV